MVRPLRIEYAGAVYHVTSRGNARKKIFVDNQDREIFIAILSAVVKRYNWVCHAYCLMGGVRGTFPVFLNSYSYLKQLWFVLPFLKIVM